MSQPQSQPQSQSQPQPQPHVPVSILPVLDHVVINTLESLDDAATTYERLGFALTERGHHSLGTSNNLAIFGENYLELLGFLPGRAPARPELVEAEPGLHGLVFKTSDADALYAALDPNGLAAEAPKSFHRPVKVGGDDGKTFEARFKTLRVEPNRVIDRRHGRVFFCDHQTPELVWRNEWRAHPNGVLDIIGFVVVAEDPIHAGDVFGKIFGDTALSAGPDGGSQLRAGAATVEFLTPKTAKQRYGATPEGPVRFVALRFLTRSTKALRQLLQDNGVPFETHGDSETTVAAPHAAGVTLHFVEEAQS